MTQRERKHLKKSIETTLAQEMEAKLLRQFERRSRSESRESARLYTQRGSALTALTRTRRDS